MIGAAVARISGVCERFMPLAGLLPLHYWTIRLQGYMDQEIRVIRSLVTRGGVMIDAGANVGVFSYALRNYFDRIEAFEPQEGCCAILRGYKGKNIVVHEVALSDEDGRSTLFAPVLKGRSSSGCASLNKRFDGSERSIEIPTRRLDSFAYKDVRFIKIDVEGHEIPVLRGALETIQRCHPVLLVECEERHQPGMGVVSELFSLMAEVGYRGWFIWRGEIHSIERFDIAVHQLPYLEEPPKALDHDYVNDFFFTKY